MKTAEELMPGGRWLSVPGTNFESAAYALAAGMTTLVSVQRSLGWSDLTTERQMYDAVKPLCNTQTLARLKSDGAEFDSQRPMDMTSLSFVIQSWNARMVSQIKVHMSCDGQNIVVPFKGHNVCKSVYIRCIGSRWEAYGYYQDSATTASHVQAAKTFSIITQIDIKPIDNTDKLTETIAMASRLVPKPWKTESIKSMFEFLHGTPDGLNGTIEALCLHTEVFDVSRNTAMRPNVDRLCSDIRQAAFTAAVLIEMFELISTDQEKEGVWKNVDEFVMREKEQQAKQKMDEAAEQKGDENIEQREDDSAEQKEDEHVEQKGDEDAEQEEEEDLVQRKRKEAEAAAAVYAAKDRDDSCSDSN